MVRQTTNEVKIRQKTEQDSYDFSQTLCHYIQTSSKSGFTKEIKFCSFGVEKNQITTIIFHLLRFVPDQVIRHIPYLPT